MVKQRPSKSKPGQTKYTLVPIDHGLSFPDNLEIDEFSLTWLGWDKAINKPFTKRSL